MGLEDVPSGKKLDKKTWWFSSGTLRGLKSAARSTGRFTLS